MSLWLNCIHICQHCNNAMHHENSKRPPWPRMVHLSVCRVHKTTRWSLVTEFLVNHDRRKYGQRISGSGVVWLRWSRSRRTPLQWRRRELALDTSQAYHPRGVCATAIISQSSSLLPRRPTARTTHAHTDANIETEKEAETQTDQETEAACILVRCALCLCVRARHAWKEEKRVLQNKDGRSCNLVVFVVDPNFSIRRLTSSVIIENVTRKVWPTKGQWRRICIELEVNVRECMRAENAYSRNDLIHASNSWS